MIPARAVFDTNVVVSALVFGARLAWLRTSWRTNCRPVICTGTANELSRVLAYPKFRLSLNDRQALLGDYVPFAETVLLPDPLPYLPVECRDRKDTVFLHLALAAGCPLVSGDRDLTVLRGIVPVTILTVGDLAPKP